MRVIEFRAWDTEFEEFVNPQYSLLGLNIKYIFMQYTGLKDKNSVKIFEGDIISVFDYDTEFLGSAEVCFKDFSWSVKWLESSEECIMPFYETFCDEKTIKVIGNIYENPELIKE